MSDTMNKVIPESNVKYPDMAKRDSFFGKVLQRSNKYFIPDQIKDEDNAIIKTNNITVVKDSIVMVTGNNTAVYLKDWQVRRIFDKELGEMYAVKINRNYFKEYTFKTNFSEFSFDKKDTFDSLWEAAKMQHEQAREIKNDGVILITSRGLERA